MRTRSGVRTIVAAQVGLVISAGLLLIAPATAVGATTFVVNRIGDGADINLANSRCDVSTASGNQCTLRAAIQEANDTPGADVINFNITSTSKVIAPSSPLPPITDELYINGYSQAGSARNTQAVGSNAVLRIVLDGVNAGPSAIGLQVAALESKVEGLVIQRFDGSGVVVSAGKVQINGNYIGTNAAGTRARGNRVGVTMIGGASCVCGGSDGRNRNVISGNMTHGVLITGATAYGNSVEANYIGTRKSGTVRLANGEHGVLVDRAPAAFIGGNGLGNVISGNGSSGVRVDTVGDTVNSVIRGNLIGTDATGTADLGNAGDGIDLSGDGMQVLNNVVSGNGNEGISMFVPAGGNIEGNRVGTNSAGTAAIGNDSDGIFIHGGSNVIIGGTSASDRNLVSGNGNRGIVLFGSGVTHTVQGNYVGTKLDGTGDLGNVGAGISVAGADDSVIGGAASGSGNLSSGNGYNGIDLVSQGRGNIVRGNAVRGNDNHGIADQSGQNTLLANAIFQNAGDGVNVSLSNSDGTTISANQIFGNGGLGIDLVGGTETALGVTANDDDDPDDGANDLQNFPVLLSATRSNETGITTVTGSLNSVGHREYIIELFMVLAPDASGHGEGQVLIASQSKLTSNNGDMTFAFQVGQPLPGHVLTATATAVLTGSTSEFSANMTVVAGP